jgi:hypothetical protein
VKKVQLSKPQPIVALAIKRAGRPSVIPIDDIAELVGYLLNDCEYAPTEPLERVATWLDKLHDENL